MTAPPTEDVVTAPGWVPGDPDGVPEGRALRDRALRAALTGYVAAHGHPLDDDGRARARGRLRWVPTRRVAVGAVVALLLLVGVVVARAALQVPGTVVPDTRTGSPADADSGTGSEGGAGPVAAGAGAVHGPGNSSATTSPGPPDDQVVVHVVGAVEREGLVELPAGARVADALEAAGGPTPEADVGVLNLARPVVDGEQVHVPLPGEEPPVPPAGGAVEPGPIDLNRADAAQLEELPGVGPVLAERIVEWRTENGGFTSVDDLAQVRGIGPSLLEQVRELVRAG